MPSSIPFYKYQATGNDFILLDAIHSLPSESVQILCDRHFGIGADGILLTSPLGSPRPSMVILNADGSRPEMCANGLRCVALHHAATMTNTTKLCISTDAGPKTCTVNLDNQPNISLDLGQIFPLGQIALHTPGATIPLHLANAGNPHAIYLPSSTPDRFKSLAPTITSHPFFPRGTNTSFVTIRGPQQIDLRVWERGVGPTLACGTAAAATTAALTAAHLLTPNTPVRVRLPGGSLTLRHDPRSLQTTLTGPARLVFQGSLPGIPPRPSANLSR